MLNLLFPSLTRLTRPCYSSASNHIAREKCDERRDRHRVNVDGPILRWKCPAHPHCTSAASGFQARHGLHTITGYDVICVLSYVVIWNKLFHW